MHKSLTPKRIMRTIEQSIHDCNNPGFCTACGAKAGGCEPMATKRTQMIDAATAKYHLTLGKYPLWHNGGWTCKDAWHLWHAEITAACEREH